MRDFEQFQAFCSSNKGKYEYLAFDAAFGRIEDYKVYNREGHYMQLFYSIYDFFTLNPELKSSAKVPAFDIRDDKVFFDAWSAFIKDNNNDAAGFTTDSLRKNLSPNCAGYRVGGGGWCPVAKLLFPTVAIYMND